MYKIGVAILTLSIVFVFSGCRKVYNQDVTEKPIHNAPIEVTLKINKPSDQPSFYTKAITKKKFTSTSFDYEISAYDIPMCKSTPTEEIINDLNIFLFYRTPAENSNDGIEHRRQEFDRHYYFSGLQADIREVKLSDVYIGEYDIYIIANNGYNMCRNTYAHIDDNGSHDPTSCVKFPNALDVDVAVSDEINFIYINRIGNSGLLMQYRDHIVFKKYGVYDESDITLTRCMSKLNLSFSTQTADGNLKFYEILLKDLASTQAIYAKNEHSTSYADYKIYTDLNVSTPELVNKEVFISSNEKGVVPGLSQLQRTARYAPANSTYLFMGGRYTEIVESESKTSNIGYMIYLWDGDSDNDFNIKQNVPYNLKVTFKTPDLSDERLLSIQNSTEDFVYQKNGADVTAKNEYLLTGTEMYREMVISGNNMVNRDVLLKATSSDNNSKNFRIELWNESTSSWDVLTLEQANLEGFELFKTPSDGARFSKKIRIVYWQTTANADTGVSVFISISAVNGAMNLPLQETRVFYIS